MPVLAALAAVYAFGYVTGSLLIDPRASFTWGVIRAVVGLLLTSIAFLLSLVLGIPWFIGPGVALALAVWRRRWDALRLPRPALTFSVDGLVTALLVAVLVAPILLSSARMAPGPFPPVFFSVDSAYFMEQVHALAVARTYPPDSLSNLGGRRTYHYGLHGMAAFLARTTGLPPHQALYAVVIPMLTAGIVAAAIATARHAAGAIPSFVAVPLLIIAVPTFWYPFWGDIVTAFREVPVTQAVDAMTQRYEMWGIATIEAHNLGAHFVVLVVLAGFVTAATRGWLLPVVLVGTAFIVKTSAGVALVAGFGLALAYRAGREKSLTPLVPAAAAVAIGAATYAAFWMLPSLPPDFSTEPYALFHVTRMREREALTGLGLDVLWLFIPVALIAGSRPRERQHHAVPLLLLALAPFLIVNVTAAIDQRPGGGGATDDWLQILSPVPLILHAFVLAFANERWPLAGRGGRTAYILALAVTVLPVVWVAGRYSRVLIEEPAHGHEFADNRAIGEALAAIPTTGTLIVTNDLRYPADDFNRDDRQMQIPALFGHQAFAVNYRYESFAFSRERRKLQELLASEQWTDAIGDAAKRYGWTHLLIHKRYVHPEPIPLARIFENGSYAVYRF